MSGPRMREDEQLEESLRRISGALDQTRHQYTAVVRQIMASVDQDVAERMSARIAEQHERRMERWQRRDERRRLKRERRTQGQAQGGDFAQGVVFLVFSVICLTMAIRQPGFFWMVFVALGFGLAGAGNISGALKKRRGEASRAEREADAEDEGDAKAAAAEEPQARAESASARPAPAPVAVAAPVPAPVVTDPPDPKVARIQRLCDKLLLELETGPPIVREVVTEPQTTIGGLRQACLEIARRERELRAVLAAQDDAGLLSERDALGTRVAGEQDDIVRERLGQALKALDQQIAHRAELATAATRLEAENTRILYTLESLHLQLLKARSTDIGAPELGGKLRDSLRELGTEIDAVAEALEWASAPVGGSAPGSERPTAPETAGPAAAEAQRAERLDAARRAEGARQAQRG
jgi:hypothetical protein